MKLVILGGAGLRTPLFINGLVQGRHGVTFDEVVLFDNNEERIALLGALNAYIVRRAGNPFQLSYTTDLREAVRGADFIFSALRVGLDDARVNDERVALHHGVLGQETTGPGGFAMALRTIPVMLEYAQIIREVAPQAWVLNFTNPAGLISQALNDYGHINVIGICDSPSGLVRRVARYMNTEPAHLQVDYIGLNHLGWVPHVWLDGKDVLPALLDSYADLRQKDAEFGFFDAELIQNIQMLPNEYLYYFYYRTESVEHIVASGQTRGEQIQQLNTRLIESLRHLIPAHEDEAAFHAYLDTIGQRHNTYMSRETSGHVHKQHDREPHHVTMGGYEEMALAVIRSFTTGDPATLIINVPNAGTLSTLEYSDVVEIPCLVRQGRYTPLGIAEVPDAAQALMAPVKAYERLTVEAAVTGDYRTALNALTIHPLVPSFSVAKAILDEYLQVHREYLPQFR